MCLNFYDTFTRVRKKQFSIKKKCLGEIVASCIVKEGDTLNQNLQNNVKIAYQVTIDFTHV